MFTEKNETTMKMFGLYEKTAAHSRIALFFTLEKRLYMTLLDRLSPEWVITDYQIDKETGEIVPALRLYMKQKDYLKLRDFHGAKCFGKASNFFDEKEEEENQGQYIERLFIETYHATQNSKNAPYYVCGDCILFGEEIQVKYMRATLARYDTILKAEKEKGL